MRIFSFQGHVAELLAPPREILESRRGQTRPAKLPGEYSRHSVHAYSGGWRNWQTRPANTCQGHVAELADALALGASGATRGGSSPSVPTCICGMGKPVGVRIPLCPLAVLRDRATCGGSSPSVPTCIRGMEQPVGVPRPTGQRSRTCGESPSAHFEFRRMRRVLLTEKGVTVCRSMFTHVQKFRVK